MPNSWAIACPSVGFQWGIFVVQTTLCLTSPAIPMTPIFGQFSESRSIPCWHSSSVRYRSETYLKEPAKRFREISATLWGNFCQFFNFSRCTCSQIKLTKSETDICTPDIANHCHYFAVNGILRWSWRRSSVSLSFRLDVLSGRRGIASKIVIDWDSCQSGCYSCKASS